MATPEKGTGNGTQVHISVDDGKTFKEFGSVTKVSAPKLTREDVDTTDNKSFENNGQMKESSPGFITADDLTVEGFYKNTDEARTVIDTAFYEGSDVQLKIVSPKFMGKTFVYKGYINSWQEFGELSPETGVSFAMSLKVQGKRVETATVGLNAAAQENAVKANVEGG